MRHLLLAAFAAAASARGEMTARIRAHDDATGITIAEVDIAVPANGMDAWSLMQAAEKQQLLSLRHKFLGPVPVIYTINGKQHDLRTTSWCLDYIEAGKEPQLNVGMLKTNVRPGDVLDWNLFPMGKCSSRGPQEESEKGEEEEGEEEEDWEDEEGEEEEGEEGEEDGYDDEDAVDENDEL